MKMNLGQGWSKSLSKKVNGVSFDVGVLDDKPHMQPVESGPYQIPKKTYAGGPVRANSRKPSGLSTGQVLIENMERLNKNILLEPFRQKNSEILKFTNYFLRYIVGRSGSSSVKRIENLLQAIVRNPILKQEYGQNSAVTADIKGFDRLLFDTGQTFKAIRARMIRRR